MTDDTAEKQKPAHLFKPGVSGNPAGRPKGARSRLGEDFLNALRDDFAEHGIEVVRKVRVKKPEVYLKIVADLMPKELQALVVHADADFVGLNTDEILAMVAADLGQDMADAIAGALEKIERTEGTLIDVTPTNAPAASPAGSRGEIDRVLEDLRPDRKPARRR